MIIESSSPADRNTDTGPRFDWAARNNIGLPLSSAQLGIWFAQQLNPQSAAYNIGEYVEIRGAIAPALFERALRQVVTESETLRVQISEHEGVPRQVIGEPSGWTLATIDFSSEPDARGAAETWMQSDLARPVDPTRGPLFGFALFKISHDVFYWYARYHHIVMDGFAMWLVARRVAHVYSALSSGGSAQEGAFGSLGVLLEEDHAYRASGQLEQDREYWSECLAGEPVAARLGGHALAKADGFLRQTAYLDESSVERLRAIAQRAGTKLPHVISAATAIFLHRMTGETDLMFGLPVSARSGAARHVPGMVSNVLPLRLSVQPFMTVGQVIGQATSQIRRKL